MDGNASKIELIETGAAEEVAPVLEAVSLHLDRPPRRSERLSHVSALVAAAMAHALLIAAFLLPRSDALGDEGVALESIAVSIVDAVPVISAPETKPSEAIEPLPVIEEPLAEPSPETPEPRKEVEKEPEPEAPALALDLPPEPEPPPDALVLPSRQPEPEPVPVVRDEPKPPIEKPPEKVEDAEKEQKEVVAAEPPAPAVAPAALPSVTSAEAAPGVVRAYARRISIALDRNKPRSRGMRGKVVVQFVVDTNGKPQPPKVLTSSGNARLDDLVVAAIVRIPFPPPPTEMSVRQRTFNVPFEYR